MQETEKFLKQAVSKVDVVMEILDARLPASSSNPLLNKICSNVLRLKILNKQDLADPDITRSWLAYFKTAQDCEAVAVTGTDHADTWRAADFSLTKVNKARTRRIRIMVAGIPNTGKSTIINSLAGKKIAKTGNTPAITRQQQRTGLKNRIDIYDTPGILWPILENEKGAYRLAVSGAISDTAIDYSDIAIFAINTLMKSYPGFLKKRYGLHDPPPEKGTNLDIKTKENKLNINIMGNNPNINTKNINVNALNMNHVNREFSGVDPLEILEQIGTARGCLKKGGIIDYQKASELLIRELRSGKIGRISFETPEEIMAENEAMALLKSIK